MPRFGDLIMPIAAKQLLMRGVTNARELGAPLEDILEVKSRIEKGEIPGPRLCAVEAKVQKLVDARVDVIKRIDQDQLTDDEVAAVVETAHKGGSCSSRSPRG